MSSAHPDACSLVLSHFLTFEVSVMTLPTCVVMAFVLFCMRKSLQTISSLFLQWEKYKLCISLFYSTVPMSNTYV